MSVHIVNIERPSHEPALAHLRSEAHVAVSRGQSHLLAEVRLSCRPVRQFVRDFVDSRAFV